MRTELHCHTTASDGRLTPTDLVTLACTRDVRVLSITDHDTLAAHAEALAAIARCNSKIQFIAGIEISALSDQGKEVHVLGYGVRPTDSATVAKIDSLRGAREARAHAILAKLAQLGISIPFERVKEIAGDGMIGRPHVARAMVERGLVPNINAAFDRYLAEGAVAFVAHDGLTPAQAVELIHTAHGAAVLAHPGLFGGDVDTLIAGLVESGLDGIEVFYPAHDEAHMYHFSQLARDAGLLLTGGSDFHGPQGDLEVTLGTVSVPRNSVQLLADRIARYV